MMVWDFAFISKSFYTVGDLLKINHAPVTLLSPGALGLMPPKIASSITTSGILPSTIPSTVKQGTNDIELTKDQLRDVLLRLVKVH